MNSSTCLPSDLSAGHAMKKAVFLFLLSMLYGSNAAALNPGLYEYTMKMNMPGAPTALPPTIQRCLSAKDVEGAKAVEMPPMPNSDCKVLNQNISGAQFSYRISCTKPQKLDGDVKGTVSATTLSMDMTMHTPGAPGPMTQNISAKRLGDCK
jgi:hypothetical protein